MHAAAVGKDSDFIVMILCVCTLLLLSKQIVTVVPACTDMPFWRCSLRPRHVKDERLKGKVSLDGADEPLLILLGCRTRLD